MHTPVSLIINANTLMLCLRQALTISVSIRTWGGAGDSRVCPPSTSARAQANTIAGGACKQGLTCFTLTYKRASLDYLLLLQVSFLPNALSPRSVFLGLGASLHGQRARTEPPFLASVPLLARALRLEHISVLKLDCEGCECAGLPCRSAGSLKCPERGVAHMSCHQHQHLAMLLVTMWSAASEHAQ